MVQLVPRALPQGAHQVDKGFEGAMVGERSPGQVWFCLFEG